MLLPWLSVSCLAGEDARFTVELVDKVRQQGSPDARALLKDALPVLWDRLVPGPERARADSIAAGSRMVARIVPGSERTIVEFNAEQVFAALRRAKIPAIISMPRFHLLLGVRNDIGMDMAQTRALLEQEAARVAPLIGIELLDGGAGLVVQWRWLDATQVELAVRGQSRLGEFVEMREINDADPLPALQQWLGELLLRARDAYAFDASMPADGMQNAGAAAAQQSAGYTIALVIERESRLLEQVALEEALAHDARVRNVLPSNLSHGSRQYRVQLQGGDTRWLAEWFSRRGYRLSRQADGAWVAR